MNCDRKGAIRAVLAREELGEKELVPFTTEHYGEDVFHFSRMKECLPKPIYQKLMDTVSEGKPLDQSIADAVAHAMKEWALEKGATHFTHWFQPMTGTTAEKHDSFLEPVGNGQAIMSFSGKNLIVSEPDASSFPSGGIRSTFEARGYTAWDPTSPAFIKRGRNGATLCIPTAFCAYAGEALDKKTPLLRSMQALNLSVKRLMKCFGYDGSKNAKVALGPEQEYFLIDEHFYYARPDLVQTGRTLFGAPPPKHQQLEDHYFGAIKPRILEFMTDVDSELWRLGIPAKTRHNEVAPAQFELAPVFEELNLAVDHNMIIMEVLKQTAEKHGLVCLLHEKPFAGINGSGKHCNWSLGTESGIGLMSPGKNDKDNLRFLTFMANVLKAVYDNNALLKACVMTASNAHRLGANEAPPAIISSFLGTQITGAFQELLNTTDMVKIAGKSKYSLGIPQIPEILLDNTDRNRTSPFAFTGNRFEFRAVGSSANCASAITVLNTIMAHQLELFRAAVDKRIADGTPAIQAVLDETRETYRSCQKVCFDGNGYSDEWKKEAAKRGLDCETSAPVCYDAFVSPETVELYEGTGVLTHVELKARAEINWEIYSKKIEIEARVLADLTANHILPVSTRYQNILLDNVSKMKDIFSDKKEFDQVAAGEIKIIKDIALHTSEARALAVKMEEECDRIDAICESRQRAVEYHDIIAPYLEKIRAHVDALEMIVDDEMWPLPKYRELLFIR